MHYTPPQIARAKALLELMTIKGAAHVTGIPWRTLRDWKRGRRHAGIGPDATIRERIAAICADTPPPPCTAGD